MSGPSAATPGTAARLAPLPPRRADVVGTLPAPFAHSMVDYQPGSVCRWRGRWVASVTAWGGKRLGVLSDVGWVPLTAEEDWSRRPVSAGSGDPLAAVLQRPDEDGACVATLAGDEWRRGERLREPGDLADWDGRRVARRTGPHDAALDARGRRIDVLDGALVCRAEGAEAWRVPVPPGATVLVVAASPSREHVLVVVRAGARYHGHVFRTADGSSASTHSLTEVVSPVAGWLDEDTVVVVREAWPGLAPLVWSWRDGGRVEPWPRGTPGAVRSLAADGSGSMVGAVSGPALPRDLRAIDDPPAPSDAVRAEVLVHDGQRVPCLVHEPAGPVRATCVMFPGGPHEPVWAEYSPIAEVLTARGCRVVRVNTRSSGLREPSLRPARAVRFGVDDLADAHAAMDRYATGPVLTMGMSYGGYLASVLSDRDERVAGAVVLAGFLSRRDLAGTEHEGVRDFVRAELGTGGSEPERTLRAPHFLAHGARDRRIPLEALHRYERLGAHLVTVPTEGHGIHSDDAARVVYPAMFDWIEEELG